MRSLLVWLIILPLGAAAGEPLTPSQWANAGRTATAIRAAREQLLAQPGNRIIVIQLSQLLQDAGQTTDAISVLQQSLQQGDDAAIRLRLARLAPTPANWQAVCERQPTPEHHEAHGVSLWRDRQFDAAVAALQRAAASPDRFLQARLHQHRCNVQLANNNPTAALASLESYLATGPNEVAPYRQFAEILRQLDRAAEIDSRLAALANQHPRALAIEWVRLAELARDRARFANAFQGFQAQLTTTTDPAFFALLLETLHSTKQTAAWLTLADMLFPAAPRRGPREASIPTHEAQRRVAFADASRQHPQFLVRVAESLTNQPRGAHADDVWELLAWAAMREQRPQLVEAALRLAMSQSTPETEFRAFQRLRLHYYRLRQWNAIVELCETTRNMSRGVRNFYRATPLAELGDTRLALEAIENAEGDNRFISRRERFHILELVGQHDTMLKECDAALLEFQTLPEIIGIRYSRSIALLGLKRFAEAEAELRGILDEEPDDVLALNNLGYNLAEQSRKLPEAEQLIRRAILLDTEQRRAAGEAIPVNAAYIDSLGWVLFRQGRLTEARTELENAAKLLDGEYDPTVWDHLGDVCLRQGDTQRADAAWQRAEKWYRQSQTRHAENHITEIERKRKLLK